MSRTSVKERVWIFRMSFCQPWLRLYVAELLARSLSEDQRAKTEELTLVLSMPVKKTESLPDGTPSITDEVLGVVNIDSKMEGAHEYYRSQAYAPDMSLIDRQRTALGRVSELYSYIMS